MRSRVMPYSLPMASSVRNSPFGERPKRSVRTFLERSGSPARSSFVTDFGLNNNIHPGFDYHYIMGFNLYSPRDLVSIPRCILKVEHRVFPIPRGLGEPRGGGWL